MKKLLLLLSANFLFFITIIIFFSCNTENIETEITAIENGLTKPIQIKGDSLVTYNIFERMEDFNVPGVSIVVVKDGAIKWAKEYGVANTETKQEVDTKTLFQAASISKPMTALAVLKLVEEGKINLDTDINTYLTSWKVSENDFTKYEKVTPRRLLTHTAGMTVPGFPGYKQTDTFPSTEMVLNGQGNTPKVYVDTIPGSVWRYSGGGYVVLQKMVEDVSGLPLEEYMFKNILQPMGMVNSTYIQPLPLKYHSSASAAHDSEGKIIEGLWHNYPEQGAGGLWTTPTDLANYCIEIQEILSGKENGILSKETVEKILTKHKNDWGLGPALMGDNDSLIFRHTGGNRGYACSLFSFAHLGNAVIVMTNATNGESLMGEIIRSISNYYNWNIKNSRIIEVFDLSSEELNKFIGKYKLDYQVPGIGDYLIEIKSNENNLLIIDSHPIDTIMFVPIEKLKFIDPDKGHDIEFESDDKSDIIGLLWNKRSRFDKIE